MESNWPIGVLKLFVACGLFICCDGATVQFFDNQDFGGTMYQTTSSSTCQTIPSGVTENWSVKSTACIAVFYNGGCTPKNSGYEDFVVREKTTALSDLRKSYRNCNHLERGPQINLDYYAETERKGERVEYRDICGCTNLPSYNSTSQSTNTYGNHFTFYKDPNCNGLTHNISNQQRYAYRGVYSMRSVTPFQLPSHCAHSYNFTAEIIKFELVSNFTDPDEVSKKVNISTKKMFANNSSQPIEYIYEGRKIISQFAEIQLSGVLHQMDVIRVRNEADLIILSNSTQPSIQRLETQLRSRFLSTFQTHNQSSSSEPIKFAVENNEEMQIQKKFMVPPCTIYEVIPFVETKETDYQIHLSITGHRGSVKVRSEDIRKNLTDLTYLSKTDDYTVLAKTTGKLVGNYGDTKFNITATPISECRSKFLTMTAQIFNIERINNISNLKDFLVKVPISDKEIFINNSTAPQEDRFEVTDQISQKGQFEFPEELNRINSISIGESFDSSIPFISTAWRDLNSGLSDIYDNRQNLNEPVKFVTQRNKTYNYQKNINVPPCQKFEVYAFAEIAKDVEMEYRVQLRVTGKLGDEVVGVDEIKDNLKGLAFLASENNQTVVAEATIKLKATFGVGSGVDAVGTPMLDCRSRFITFSANIIELERVTSGINETTKVERVAVAPKHIFINNGTTHQEETYVATKEIMETAEFLFAEEFDSITFLNVEVEVKNELGKSIPFLSNIWSKLTSGLSPNQSILKRTTSYRVENKKEFRVQREIAVAPCTSYEIDSFIQMTDRLEVNYRALLEITGKLGSEKVLAEEIRGNLKHVSFIRDKDDFTVLAETNMKLILNYGTSSGVNVEGKQMLDCLAIQAEIVGNCKFVCSG